MNGSIIAVLPVAAMFGIAGYRVGTRRGRAVLGAVLGFALGLVGLGIFMLIPRTAEAQAWHDRERAERQQRGPDSQPVLAAAGAARVEETTEPYRVPNNCQTV